MTTSAALREKYVKERVCYDKGLIALDNLFNLERFFMPPLDFMDSTQYHALYTPTNDKFTTLYKGSTYSTGPWLAAGELMRIAAKHYGLQELDDIEGEIRNGIFVDLIRTEKQHGKQNYKGHRFREIFFDWALREPKDVSDIGYDFINLVHARHPCFGRADPRENALWVFGNLQALKPGGLCILECGKDFIDVPELRNEIAKLGVQPMYSGKFLNTFTTNHDITHVDVFKKPE
jgi:hypothetical protein